MITYTAGTVADKLGLSKDALRYYEKEGLLPPISRDQSGHRAYTDENVDWIFLIRCLRDTDMPICKIKQYICLLKSGGHTIPERREVLKDHQNYIQEKMITYQKLLELVHKKIEFYDEEIKEVDSSNLGCIRYEDEWKNFKTILGGIKHD